MAPLATRAAHLSTNLSNLTKRYYYYSYYTFPVGAIVGIVIVCIVIFLLLVLICVRRNRRRTAAIPYQPQPYRANNNINGAPGYGQPGYSQPGYSQPGQYNNGYMVPSQYGNQQTELGQMPKHGDGGPIQPAPPVYSGPGTFYNSNNQGQGQDQIVR